MKHILIFTIFIHIAFTVSAKEPSSELKVHRIMNLIEVLEESKNNLQLGEIWSDNSVFTVVFKHPTKGVRKKKYKITEIIDITNAYLKKNLSLNYFKELNPDIIITKKINLYDEKIIFLSYNVNNNKPRVGSNIEDTLIIPVSLKGEILMELLLKKEK